MAAATTPTAPGSRFGPCKKSCKHRDCADGRRMVAAECRFCAKPLGYGSRYYGARFSDAVAHALCLETAVERNDARVGLF